MNQQKTLTNHLPRCTLLLALLFVILQIMPRLFGHGKDGEGASLDPSPPSDCVWTSATAFPIPIMDEAVVTLGNNVYTFGGLSEGLGVSNAYKFDGVIWTPIAPYPSDCGVEWPSAVTDGTFIYITNGAKFCPFTYSTDLLRYDPQTDTYTPLASNNVGTWNQTAAYLNGKIYKIGGRSAAGYQATLEVYDIVSNMWSPGTPLPQPAGFAASWTWNGFVYVAGGVIESGVYTNKTYRYDPVTNNWDDAAIADLPEERWGAATAVYGDSVVLSGGFVGPSGNLANSAVYWDPNADEWVSLPDMPEARGRMNGAALGVSFNVVGGTAIPGDLTGTTTNQKLTCQFGPTPTPTPTATPTASPTPTGTPRVTPRPRPIPQPRPTPP